MTYTTTVELDDVSDEFYLQLPPDLLVALGWRLGDNLEWTIEEQTVTIRRVTAD